MPERIAAGFDRETRAPFDLDLEVYDRISDYALRNGVYAYPGRGSTDDVAGDYCMLAPPLTTSNGSLEEISATLADTAESTYEAIVRSSL